MGLCALFIFIAWPRPYHTTSLDLQSTTQCNTMQCLQTNKSFWPSLCHAQRKYVRCTYSKHWRCYSISILTNYGINTVAILTTFWLCVFRCCCCCFILFAVSSTVCFRWMFRSISSKECEIEFQWTQNAIISNICNPQPY